MRIKYLCDKKHSIHWAHTSTCISEVSPAQEPQVSGSGPHSLSVSKAQPGSEMIRTHIFLSEHSEVPTGILWTMDPDLHSF